MLRVFHRRLHPLFPLVSLNRPPLLLARFLSATTDAKHALVLSVLRSHDVADEHSRSILAKFPGLVQHKANNIEPKLSFLRSSGLSGPELADILLSNPFILRWSLDRALSPALVFLKSILPSHKDLIRVLKRLNVPLTPKHEANIGILKDEGIPAPAIHKILVYQPRLFVRPPERIIAAVEYAKELGFDPTTMLFVTAVSVVSYTSKSTFQRKVELFKELGWSEEEVLTLFRRYPLCMNKSDQAIRRKVGYFMDTIGYSPELLCVWPMFLAMSLDKRIIPRCATLDVLMSRGLVKMDRKLVLSKFNLKEESFYKKYVSKYEEEIPEVAAAFQGKIQFCGWNWFKEDSKEDPKCRES